MWVHWNIKFAVLEFQPISNEHHRIRRKLMKIAGESDENWWKCQPVNFMFHQTHIKGSLQAEIKLILHKEIEQTNMFQEVTDEQRAASHKRDLVSDCRKCCWSGPFCQQAHSSNKAAQWKTFRPLCPSVDSSEPREDTKPCWMVIGVVFSVVWSFLLKGFLLPNTHKKCGATASRQHINQEDPKNKPRATQLRKNLQHTKVSCFTNRKYTHSEEKQ